MHTLENTVKKIHYTPENGLVFCDKLHKDIPISERYHIQEKASSLGEVKAVLFRRKYNEDGSIIGSKSKPLLYLYEKDNDFFNSPEHKKLHAKIWSAGDIDVYVIISTTRIDIINARKPAEVKNDNLDLRGLRLISDALEMFNDQRFSAFALARGTFWEQEDFFDPQKDNFYKNQLKEENTPFHQLLEYLMVVRGHLHDEQRDLSPNTVDKLLIICILVKFLEEIKDDDEEHTLRDIYRKHNIDNFAEALEGGICLPILSQLGSEFNGNIFYNFSEAEKSEIRNTDLSLVASFLRGNIDLNSGQYFLWQQYKFDYLPAELISAIYERFLPQEKGVVYTPPFLVNFLIDEVMPLDKAEMYFSQNKFRVFDPSCGSGVFLVAAYKRMLQWWSINDYHENNKSKFSKPKKNICQEILENNIFGVDIHPTATLISVFGLTIALLDKLEPNQIWNNLKLNNLQENIQTKDFFEWATDTKRVSKMFDLVIGNPPFEPISGITEKDAVSESQIQKFGISNKDIPGNNFALKFFEGAMFFGKHTCLILPSNILLYTKTQTAQKYRSRLFTQFTVNKIFDFTHLREVLFVKKITNQSNGQKKTGRVPVSAILANSEESQGQKIKHIVIKRLSSTEKNIFLEIDHYDYHTVPHNWATDSTKQFVWKTNLLGGGRLFHLIYRLSLLPTLKDFINSHDNWMEIRGFEGGTKLVAENQDKIVGVTENGEPEIERNVDIYSNNLKSLHMYEPPFMIVAQFLGGMRLPCCFISTNNDFTKKKHLYYNRNFIGISVPSQDEDILENIYKRISVKQTNKKLNYQLFVASTSSNCLVLHDTAIRQGDVLSVPYPPQDKSYLELSEAEKFIQDDVLEYYIHLGKAISETGAGKKLYKKVSKHQLKQFGQVFCDTLNSIYARNGKSWQHGGFSQTNSFTIFQLGYGPNDELPFQRLDESDEVINSLIYNSTSHRGSVFTRVARIYKHVDGYDCVFLIKPSAMRYWLNSIALRDADETFVDLREAGR